MKAIVGLLVILSSLSVHAQRKVCDTRIQLSCEMNYITTQMTTVKGPSESNFIVDRQPEPSDQADCLAAVVLYSYVGKVVVSYNQIDGSFTGSLKNEYRFSFLKAEPYTKESSAPLMVFGAVKYSIASPYQGDVKSADLLCWAARERD